jgi:hypothetical protein
MNRHYFSFIMIMMGLIFISGCAPLGPGRYPGYGGQFGVPRPGAVPYGGYNQYGSYPQQRGYVSRPFFDNDRRFEHEEHEEREHAYRNYGGYRRDWD